MDPLQPKSFTIIELEDKKLRVMGVKIPDFKPFDRMEFPDSIKSGELVVKHRDIENGSTSIVKASVHTEAVSPVVIGIDKNNMNVTIPFADTYEITLFSLNGQKIGSFRKNFSIGKNQVSLEKMKFANRMVIACIFSKSV